MSLFSRGRYPDRVPPAHYKYPMKYVALIICLQIVATFGFPTDRNAEALRSAEKAYHTALGQVLINVDQLSRALQSGRPLSEIREIHLSTRLAFKEVEWLMAFNDPQSVGRLLNGAPLPKTEQHVPEVTVLAPKGLQIIDEILFSEVPDRKEVAKLIDQFRRDFQRCASMAESRHLQHRMVFEAAREGVVRVYTLGLTGFDTPGSVNALAEGRRAMAAIHSALRGYDDGSAEFNELNIAFARAGELLAVNDFNTFDRLQFLRDVINAITRASPQVQGLLGIERSEDDARLPRATNSEAPYLFSPDYLRAGYYANLDEHPRASARRALGELLFFDPLLSKDLTLSCASCHDPEKAFTDGGRAEVLRNAPTLINSVYAEKYFYDLREEFLERQVKHVVVDRHEFNTDFLTIEKRLRQSPEYVEKFAAAYGDQPAYQLSKWSVSDALTHYVASLTAWDSEFDRYARSETDAIAEDVRRGYNIFMGKAACGTCHFAPTFSGLVPPAYTESESEVLGVPAGKIWSGARIDGDLGRVVNGRPEDEAYFHRFGFKTPTVRNVAVTAPYMHNGVYDDLDEVMKFYNLGGGAGIGIDVAHQTLPFDSLSLTDPEVQDVIAFMQSLTDYEGLNHRPRVLPSFPQRPEWNERLTTY